MITISEALTLLKDKREAEILLAHTLHRPRSFLYAYPEKTLTNTEEIFFKELIARRKQNEPVAYLTGHQEFWSLDFLVTRDVLIPRPETELLVETLLDIFPSSDKKVIADLGTGSGCIALAIAHEKPTWEIHATDKSEAAIRIAQKNAERLEIKNCFFHLGNWCDALPEIKFDAILSNPPYITENDSHLSSLSFEPLSALVSGKEGLDAITQIIKEAKDHLKSGGLLMLEYGYQQAEVVKELFSQEKYNRIISKFDLLGWERVVYGTSG